MPMQQLPVLVGDDPLAAWVCLSYRHGYRGILFDGRLYYPDGVFIHRLPVSEGGNDESGEDVAVRMTGSLLLTMDLHYLPAILIYDQCVGIGELHLHVISIQEKPAPGLREQYCRGRPITGYLQRIAFQFHL